MSLSVTRLAYGIEGTLYPLGHSACINAVIYTYNVTSSGRPRVSTNDDTTFELNGHDRGLNHRGLLVSGYTFRICSEEGRTPRLTSPDLSREISTCILIVGRVKRGREIEREKKEVEVDEEGCGCG